MAILIDENTKIVVQGLGKQGSCHLKLMKKYGTRIVAAVSRSKTGSFEGVPIYKTVKDAVTEHKADFSILFVPAKFTKEAAIEALNCGLNIIIITEGIPVHDTLEIMQVAKKSKEVVIGPNCPGIISPGKSKIGIMPADIFKPGSVGIVSRSGTLTYEISDQMTKQDIGQSTVIGIGGDPVIGLDFIRVLKMFEKDKETKAIVLIGEIGGNLEERAAEFIKEGSISKKIVAYIAGVSAPKGKRMGHAGAIVEGDTGTAKSKIEALEQAGVKVASLASEVVNLLKISL